MKQQNRADTDSGPVRFYIQTQRSAVVHHIKSVEIVPNPATQESLMVVATRTDGLRFVYVRLFALKDRAHAEYFTRLIRERCMIEADQWTPCDKEPKP